MYSIGDKVVYKANAVCTVEAIETPAFVNEKEKLYYKLRSIFSANNETIYVPVDAEAYIRPCLTGKEAKKKLEVLKTAEVVPFEQRQPALINAHYQNMLADCSFESSLLVLKEITLRKIECEKQGKTLRQIESHYLSVAEKTVCEELSVAFDRKVEEIRQILEKEMLAE